VLFERGDLDFGAERRVRERDVHARDEVRAVALEARIFFDVDLDVQISRLGARRPGHALTLHAEALAGVDARGKRDRHLARLLNDAVALAGLARRADDLPLALAPGTRRGEHDEAARVRDVAGAAALGARLGLGARARAGAAAVAAARGGVDA